MSCQSRYVGEMVSKRPLRSYIDTFLVNFGMKLKLDIFLGKLAFPFLRLLGAQKTVLTMDQIKMEFPLLDLKEGDRVLVRSREEIAKTLDGRAFLMKMGECYFLDGMWDYCGGEYVVEKKVNYFFDELAYKMYRTRDVVLLRGVHCPGIIPFFKYSCDRSCLYFWKESWLERA